MILLLALAVLGFAFYEAYLKHPAEGTVAGYASKAGFSGFALIEAVAIAYAESSGDPNAIGDLNLGRSIGLWQVNLAAHPEYSEEELLDPQTNANAAFAIYQAAGDSFTPWTTFNTGKYSENLDRATTESQIYLPDESGTDNG